MRSSVITRCPQLLTSAPCLAAICRHLCRYYSVLSPTGQLEVRHKDSGDTVYWATTVRSNENCHAHMADVPVELSD